MNALKVKLLEQLMSHMKSSQGEDFKNKLMMSKKPMMEEGSPEEEKMESPSEEMMEDKMGGMPKVMEVEKVSLKGKPMIAGISMGRHRRMAEPGEKDLDLKAMVDKKSGGVGAEPQESDGLSEEDLEELLSQY